MQVFDTSILKEIDPHIKSTTEEIRNDADEMRIQFFPIKKDQYRWKNTYWVIKLTLK